MSQDFIQNESIPHKKAGKNQLKSSPNKKGCEMNDFQPHEFANFDTIYFLPSKGHYQVVSNYAVRCVDCGKRRSRKVRKPLDQPAIATVALFSDGYWEIELNKLKTRITKISQMNW